jgi:hypothetical protein
MPCGHLSNFVASKACDVPVLTCTAGVLGLIQLPRWNFALRAELCQDALRSGKDAEAFLFCAASPTAQPHHSHKLKV